MIVRGIDNLDYHTPKILASLWQDYKKEYSISDKFTTVYHFGFSEEDGLIHAYAYRSGSNFVSESLGYGFGVTPEYPLSEKYEFPR